MTVPESPLRLRIDGAALIHNWQWLRSRGGGAACGAAVKANGYGIGAAETVRALALAGCRDFFVSSWAEVAALGAMPDGAVLSVFHGVRPEDMAFATAGIVKPVLNSVDQIALWRQAGAGRACDVMLDTGMHRLGLSIDDVRAGACNGLDIDVVMGHFSSADDDDVRTAAEMALFDAAAAHIAARRRSIANSAGIAGGGARYALDLTGPDLRSMAASPAARPQTTSARSPNCSRRSGTATSSRAKSTPG
ncbi:MAG: alanine racemase [Sphingomonadales bacterium]|nr:alanine racemase [Sphingomonadales bacterium]